MWKYLWKYYVETFVMRFRRVRGNIMGPSEAPVPREAHAGVVGLRWSHVFPWLFKTHFSRSVKCISLILLVLLRGSNWPKRDFSVIFMLSSIFPTPQCHALVFCNTLERVCFAQLLSMYDLVPALLCWLIHEGLLEPRWGLWQSWARCTATKRGGDKCNGWHQTLMCNVTSWKAHRCIFYISLSLGFGNIGSQPPTRW